MMTALYIYALLIIKSMHFLPTIMGLQIHHGRSSGMIVKIPDYINKNIPSAQGFLCRQTIRKGNCWTIRLQIKSF